MISSGADLAGLPFFTEGMSITAKAVCNYCLYSVPRTKSKYSVFNNGNLFSVLSVSIQYSVL